jgi:hypothetical protein
MKTIPNTPKLFPVKNPYRPDPNTGWGEIWRPAFEFADLTKITAQVPGTDRFDTMRVQLWLAGAGGRNHGTAFPLN